MKTAVTCTSSAATITKEAGHGIGRTGCKVFSEDVEVCHGMTLGRVLPSGKQSELDIGWQGRRRLAI
jgi:hypothetical protein